MHTLADGLVREQASGASPTNLLTSTRLRAAFSVAAAAIGKRDRGVSYDDDGILERAVNSNFVRRSNHLLWSWSSDHTADCDAQRNNSSCSTDLESGA
jgi:hypothetical protein